MLRAVLGRSGILWDGSFHPPGSCRPARKGSSGVWFLPTFSLRKPGRSAASRCSKPQASALKTSQSLGPALSPLHSASGLWNASRSKLVFQTVSGVLDVQGQGPGTCILTSIKVCVQKRLTTPGSNPVSNWFGQCPCASLLQGQRTVARRPDAPKRAPPQGKSRDVREAGSACLVASRGLALCDTRQKS